MILLPYLRRPPLWVLSGGLVVIQLCIDLAGAVFFIKLQHPDFTGDDIAMSERITLAESIWFSLVESVLFFATQYKIISAVTEVQQVASSPHRATLSRHTESTSQSAPPTTSRTTKWTSFVLHFKGMLRSAFFSANIVMTYLTLGGYFGPNKYEILSNFGPLLTPDISWSSNGLCICVLILMTDALRFQSAIDIIRSDNNTGGGSISTAPRTSAGLRSFVPGSRQSRGKVHPEAKDIGSSDGAISPATIKVEVA
ncbi:hypothetical protein BJ742DRAFT_913375 [Cladochytrium replicatum]|nr:hypothetical protein BJ742DRAFT_913375 [Cladochytrium replicatum]